MAEVTESILFRQKLYENFKQSGMLDKLKTSLRYNLLDKLQKPQISQIYQKKQSEKKPLHLRDKFLACIVSQYLQKSTKQYTKAIFLPEAQLSEDDCLNYNQLAQILNFPGIQQDNISFLQKFVEEWMRVRAVGVNQRSTQTDYSEPVSKKLEDIQKKYRKQIDYWKLIPNAHSSIRKDQNSSSLSGNLGSMSQQQRMKQQLQLDRKRIKRDLQGVIKAQMEKRYEDKYSTRLKQVQKAHEGRLFELKNREKSILDSLQRKKKQLQNKAHKLSEDQMKMIKSYEIKISELQLQYKLKMKELEKKQKQFWKKQLELRAKKKQYQDSIRLVKQKVIQETLNL